jgi:hypothetical protein
MSEVPSEKKIFVDEDWKSRVEAEREAARQKAPPGQPAGEGQAPAAAAPEPAVPEPEAPEPAATEPAATDKPRAEAEADPAMPPADLMFVASTFYMQALVALGVVPDPITRKPRLRPNQARHAIDSLQVLLDKTQGNRTAEESEAIDAMLHELRMAFVRVMQAANEKPT